MYINPNILEEDWDALGSWTDGDINGAVSSISPAGQLYLDCRAMTAIGWAERLKDIGTIGTGNYYIEIRFKGDVWDYYDAINRGIRMVPQAGINQVFMYIGNGFVDGDGIRVYDGAAFNLVYEHTWDTNWHTIVFFVHNNQTDMDIWVDKDPRTEGADVTDADCSYATETDGLISVRGNGNPDGNGEYHTDYIYIGDEVLSSSSSSSSSSNSSLSSSSFSSFSSSSSFSFSSSSSSFSSSSSSSSSSFSFSSSSSSSSFSSSSSSSSSLSSSSSSSVSSLSSSSFSSLSFSSSSSSHSAYPVAWGIAWGEKDCDQTETAESWATWSDGAGGAVIVFGDADWGRLFLGKDVVAHSPVHYFSALDSHTTLTKNKYGPGGVGSFKVYYRESDTPFLQDDGAPAWSLYTNPVRLTKTYRQVKLVGE